MQQKETTGKNNLRRVIKLNNDSSEDEETDSEDNKESSTDEQESQKKQLKNNRNQQDQPLKKQLKEKKEYLKQLKEFDFRINENKKQLEELTEQLNSVTGNLDDLVSLYEIVSEQMNPFVGLSRVTKKRIDALENYSKEIENLKTKMMQIESDLEQRQFKEIPKKEMKPPVNSHQSVKTEVEPKKNESIIPSTPTNFSVTDEQLEHIVDEAIDTVDEDHELEHKISIFLDTLA
ncbi:MAG: flagella accessory protein C [Thermoplasmatota archaeon]